MILMMCKKTGSSFFPHMLAGKNLRQFIIKMVLMAKIAHGRTYSYELVKELSHHAKLKRFVKDRKTMKNEVYNNIASLEKSGLIKTVSASVHGSARKYYVLTPKGRAAIRAAKAGMAETVKSLSKILR